MYRILVFSMHLISVFCALPWKQNSLDANISKFKSYLSEMNSFLTLLSESEEREGDGTTFQKIHHKYCALPAIINCKRKGNITYREDMLGMGRKCLFSSWRLKSSDGPLKLTLMYLSMSNSPERGTYLAAYQGGSEEFTLLFETSGADSVFLKSYESLSKEIFIKLYASTYPTGWRFTILYEVWGVGDTAFVPNGFNDTFDERRQRHDTVLTEGDKDGCNGEALLLTGNSGAFYSPNYLNGKGYPGRSNCSWLIALDPGNTVELKFESFSIEPAFPLTSMCFDALRIYDGPKIDSKNLRRTHCGKEVPQDFHSTSNLVLLNFQSDEETNNFTGFAIKFRAVEGTSLTTRSFSCGIPKIQPNIYNRIVGGVQAKPHSWPWQISLQYFGQHVCGACLIHSSWVLTAAHCLADIEKHSDVLVRLGEHNLAMMEGTEETRQVDYSIIHPNYNSNTNDFDLALLHLGSEVTYNDYVSPVCLPSGHQGHDDLVCVVAGWGTTKDASYNVVLNQLTIPFIETLLCNDRRWYNGKVTSNMFCAGYKEGRRDSCQGDSGGPLVCSDGAHWSVLGIISWGFDCAQPRHPGVYTNVTVMKPWIHDSIKNNTET